MISIIRSNNLQYRVPCVGLCRWAHKNEESLINIQSAKNTRFQDALRLFPKMMVHRVGNGEALFNVSMYISATVLLSEQTWSKKLLSTMLLTIFAARSFRESESSESTSSFPLLSLMTCLQIGKVRIPLLLISG